MHRPPQPRESSKTRAEQRTYLRNEEKRGRWAPLEGRAVVELEISERFVRDAWAVETDRTRRLFG